MRFLNVKHSIFGYRLAKSKKRELVPEGLRGADCQESGSLLAGLMRKFQRTKLLAGIWRVRWPCSRGRGTLALLS